MSIQVVDFYSGNRINAEFEKATGTDGAIVKAGQGMNWGYLRASKQQIEDFKKVGIPLQYYWLVDARYSPESHKAAIKQAFPPDEWRGKLFLWLDLEKPVLAMPDWMYTRLKYAYSKPVESIIRMMLETYGEGSVGIYTSPGAYKLILGGAPKSLQMWFSGFPLWTAQYKSAKVDMYGYWKSYLMHQYQENPDYSIFNGMDDDFKKVFKIAEELPEETGPKIGALLVEDAKRLNDPQLSGHVFELEEQAPELFK